MLSRFHYQRTGQPFPLYELWVLSFSYEISIEARILRILMIPPGCKASSILLKEGKDARYGDLSLACFAESKAYVSQPSYSILP